MNKPTRVPTELLRQALAQALLTAPLEGERVLTGYICGVYCETSKSQRDAYHKAIQKIARQTLAARKVAA